MKKINIIFVLDHALKSYRVPFFNLLSDIDHYQITIVHPGKEIEGLNKITQLKSYTIFKCLGVELRNKLKIKENDVIIYMQNIRIANLWLITLNPFKNYKLIHWGIGTSSSKRLSLNKNLFTWFRNMLAKHASALILYTDFPLSLFSAKVKEKTFIANNTIFNPLMENLSGMEKDSFIFIGSLDKRKGLDLLLKSFSSFSKKTGSPLKLVIIGSGSEELSLKILAKQLDIENLVEFKRAITDDKLKKEYFRKAIACVSPLQAGLSVLESFSYGVPFITYRNAISGGEHLNIINYNNGMLVNNENELTTSLMKINEDRELAKRLGNNAYKHYYEKRQMKHMVSVFKEAIDYVNKQDI